MEFIIYHLAFRSDWETAVIEGEYRAPSLAEEGFIHASGDEAQMLGVAARLFAGRTDLLALDVDSRRLPESSPLVWEPSRSGEIYPHVYGPINLHAVVRIRAIAPDEASASGFALGGAG